MRPGGSMRPRIENPVIDFPDPDSPTIPSVSPARTLSVALFTAFTCPSCTGLNYVTLTERMQRGLRGLEEITVTVACAQQGCGQEHTLMKGQLEIATDS